MHPAAPLFSFPSFSPVLGLVTSCLVSALWLSPFLKQPNVPYDVIGVTLFSLSAITELLAEPLWVLSQTHNYVKLKVCVSMATINRVVGL